MKIIDILNKIANKEEVPKKITFNGDKYEYFRIAMNLFNYKNIDNGKFLSETYNIEYILNDEVEIIEEKPKELKEIQIENDSPTHFYVRNENGTKCGLTKHSKIIAEKVNELVKAVNYLLEKDK